MLDQYFGRIAKRRLFRQSPGIRTANPLPFLSGKRRVIKSEYYFQRRKEPLPKVTDDPILPMNRLLFLLAALLFTSGAFAQQAKTFVFVKVAESIMPIARGNKYEDPLDEALKKARLGEVTGGGSSLSKEGKIEWVGLDVELTDLMKGMPFLRKKLIELGAPKGSTMEYQFNGTKKEVPIHE